MAREETLYQEICKVYDRDLRDKRMDSRLFNEIATSVSLPPHQPCLTIPTVVAQMEKKRRLSADVEKMESSVCNLEKFSLPLPSCAGTPSPSPTTSTLSSLGSISPKCLPEVRPTAKPCPSLPVHRIPQSLHHKQSSGSLVPNASDQVGSLIVAELNSSSSRPHQPAETLAKVKEPKPKKETKKRERVSLKREAKSQAAVPAVTDRSPPPLAQPLCFTEVDKSAGEPRPKPYDLSEAKISIKSPRGSPKCRPSSPTACPTVEPGAESRPSSQSAGTSSDKERLTLTFVINRENNSASVKSPIKDGSRTGAAERSPSSTSAKNSPKSEPTKRKFSVTSGAKKKKHRSSRSSGPDTSSESETKLKIKFGGSGGAGDHPVVGPAVAQSPAADMDQRLSGQSAGSSVTRRPETSFERLLEIAANEREQNNRLEQERKQALDLVTTVPSSTSSNTHVTAAAAAAPTTTQYSDLPVSGKRCNPPSLTPDRPIAPYNRQQDVSPLLSHLYQQRESGPAMSSLQSMKNLASLTSSLSPALHPVPDQCPAGLPPPPKRKPGRPPKKSISAESWVPGPPSSSSSCMQQQQQQAKTLVSIPPAHGSSSFPSCQMDQFPGSHSDSIDYSVMKGGRSSGSVHSSSVIQSGGRTGPPPPPSSSPSFPGNNYYSHAAYARSYAGK